MNYILVVSVVQYLTHSCSWFKLIVTCTGLIMLVLVWVYKQA